MQNRPTSPEPVEQQRALFPGLYDNDTTYRIVSYLLIDLIALNSKTEKRAAIFSLINISIAWRNFMLDPLPSKINYLDKLKIMDLPPLEMLRHQLYLSASLTLLPDNNSTIYYAVCFSVYNIPTNQQQRLVIHEQRLVNEDGQDRLKLFAKQDDAQRYAQSKSNLSIMEYSTDKLLSVVPLKPVGDKGIRRVVSEGYDLTCLSCFFNVPSHLLRKISRSSSATSISASRTSVKSSSVQSISLDHTPSPARSPTRTK